MNNFENWLKEIESFHLRLERVYEETVDHPQGSEAAKRQWENIKGWLKAAYEAGYERRSSEINNG